jgi:hypothetical protein
MSSRGGAFPRSLVKSGGLVWPGDQGTSNTLAYASVPARRTWGTGWGSLGDPRRLARDLSGLPGGGLR